jgi:hypothetical protein
MTPSHTAIRIVKKRKELDCNLDAFELDLVRHALEWRFNDIIRVRFRERYFGLYKEYIDELKDYFTIHKDQNTEAYVKNSFGEEVNLYYLSSIFENKQIPFDENSQYVYGNEVFRDENLCKIYNSLEFLFYMRNIYNNENLSKLWSKLYFFFTHKHYIDCQPSDEDLELINRLANYAPDSIDNLKGKTLSEQIKLVKWILKEYEEDPIVAISILEKHRLSQDELDSQDLFLLELSVRKQIINDTKGKVNKVLGIKKEIKNDSPINNPEWWS